MRKVSNEKARAAKVRRAARDAEPSGEGTRRTGGVRTSGRAARVVEDVLCATSQELSRVGYAALRIEDVAQRSGVNKTTIYRRWPTKAELVAAALQGLSIQPTASDTGTLRGDLLEYLQSYAAFAGSSLGRGISRMMLSERTHPEVEPIARALREKHRRSRASIVERAIARGELPEGTSPALVAELAFAPVYTRLVTQSAKADDAFLGSVVDVVIAGARAGAAIAR